jgi:hypothetical protein
MASRAFPFLISSHQRWGYYIFVAPSFIVEAKVEDVLWHVIRVNRSALDNPASLFLRQIHNMPTGNLTAIFQVVEDIIDGMHRPIHHFEGFLIRKFLDEKILISQKSIELIHDFVNEIWLKTYMKNDLAITSVSKQFVVNRSQQLARKTIRLPDIEWSSISHPNHP